MNDLTVTMISYQCNTTRDPNDIESHTSASHWSDLSR